MRRRDALEQKKTALTRTNAADRLFLDGLRGELGALRTAVEPLRMKLSSGNRRGTTSSDGFFADEFRDVRAAEILRDASLPPPLYVLFAALVGVAERRGLETSLENEMVVSFETGGEDEAAEAGDLPRSRRSRRAPEKTTRTTRTPTAADANEARAPSHDEGAEAMDGKDFGKNKQRAQTKETETTASTRIVPAPARTSARDARGAPPRARMNTAVR